MESVVDSTNNLSKYFLGKLVSPSITAQSNSNPGFVTFDYSVD